MTVPHGRRDVGAGIRSPNSSSLDSRSPNSGSLDESSAKRYRLGTHRSRPPEETLALLSPQLATFGITRVADVTGLDRVGIPVFMAIRPNSRSLAVSQGKGIEPIAAKVSGIMEAVELHHAERITRPVRLESWYDLAARATVADPSRLPLIRSSLFSPTSPIPWVEAVDVASAELAAVWIPFELVHANTTVPPMPGSGCFDRGTNGLASGNTDAEAVLHGVCEVVERDALALWEHSPPDRRRATRLDVATVDDDSALGLLERFRRTDIHVDVWDVTSDVGLPTFRVVIFDGATDVVLNPMGAALGSGCHPDREIALCRALTEAAQSRLTAIAGSRDTLVPTLYGSEQAGRAEAEHERERRSPSPTVDYRSVPSLATTTVDGDLDVAVSALRAAGLASVLVVDLSEPTTGIHVVRVVVPGLEGPTESTVYRPGRRVRALVEAGRR